MTRALLYAWVAWRHRRDIHHGYINGSCLAGRYGPAGRFLRKHRVLQTKFRFTVRWKEVPNG